MTVLRAMPNDAAPGGTRLASPWVKDLSVEDPYLGHGFWSREQDDEVASRASGRRNDKTVAMEKRGCAAERSGK